MSATCARYWCSNPVGPGGYCSTQCARVNALLTPPSGIPFHRPRTVRSRYDAELEEEESAPRCPRCMTPVMIVHGPQPGHTRRVNATPSPDGRLVLLGDRVIAELRGPRMAGWEGYAFAPHQCRVVALTR